jgi:hypothetical protein
VQRCWCRPDVRDSEANRVDRLPVFGRDRDDRDQVDTFGVDAVGRGLDSEVLTRLQHRRLVSALNLVMFALPLAYFASIPMLGKPLPPDKRYLDEPVPSFTTRNVNSWRVDAPNAPWSSAPP